MIQKSENNHGKLTEKRKSERNKVDLSVRYRSGSRLDLSGIVLDISFGGMFLKTKLAHNRGDHIQADLDIEDYGKIAWVHGNVVRTTPTGVGVKFTNFDVYGVDDAIHLHSKTNIEFSARKN